jgi:hypothetical protein
MYFAQIFQHSLHREEQKSIQSSTAVNLHPITRGVLDFTLLKCMKPKPISCNGF